MRISVALIVIGVVLLFGVVSAASGVLSIAGAPSIVTVIPSMSTSSSNPTVIPFSITNSSMMIGVSISEQSTGSVINPFANATNGLPKMLHTFSAIKDFNVSVVIFGVTYSLASNVTIFPSNGGSSSATGTAAIEHGVPVPATTLTQGQTGTARITESYYGSSSNTFICYWKYNYESLQQAFPMYGWGLWYINGQQINYVSQTIVTNVSLLNISFMQETYSGNGGGYGSMPTDIPTIGSSYILIEQGSRIVANVSLSHVYVQTIGPISYIDNGSTYQTTLTNTYHYADYNLSAAGQYQILGYNMFTYIPSNYAVSAGAYQTLSIGQVPNTLAYSLSIDFLQFGVYMVPFWISVGLISVGLFMRYVLHKH